MQTSEVTAASEVFFSRRSGGLGGGVYNFPNMRNFLFILVVFLGAVFLYSSFGELETILQTLKRGNFWFILSAVLLQCGWFLVSGMTYLSLYRLLGMEGSLYELSLMSTAANFVNTVAPSAGMGGMAVFISSANRNNLSPGKATVAGMVSLFLDYLAFLVVLTLGLLVLIRRNDLNPSEIAASAIMFAVAAALGALLYLGSRSAKALGKALAWMARLVNRLVPPFLHRPYLSEERAHHFAGEMAADLQSLPGRLHGLIKPMALALLNKTLLMGVLAASFLAFQVPFSTGTIIGGFAISYLFLIVSPTPSGIGIVEGVMPLALSSLRVPWSQAVVITFAYRGITFWFPLGVGALALRILNRSSK